MLNVPKRKGKTQTHKLIGQLWKYILILALTVYFTDRFKWLKL